MASVAEPIMSKKLSELGIDEVSMHVDARSISLITVNKTIAAHRLPHPLSLTRGLDHLSPLFVSRVQVCIIGSFSQLQ